MVLKGPHGSSCAPEQCACPEAPLVLSRLHGWHLRHPPEEEGNTICFSFADHKYREQHSPGVRPVILQFDPNTLLGTRVVYALLFSSLSKPRVQVHAESPGCVFSASPNLRLHTAQPQAAA